MPDRSVLDFAKPVRLITAALLVIVVAATLLQIVMRYVFNAPLIWSEELSKFLIVWLTFLGAAAVCYDGRHLNVDVVFKMLPAKARTVVRWFNIAVSLTFLSILGWTSIKLIKLEMRQDLSSLPLSEGHIRMAATVGCALMVVAILLRVHQRRKASSDDPDDVM